MALTILDQTKVATLLSAMWKKHLKTNLDPANNDRADGINHNGVGLCGGLTDSIDNTAIFDMHNKNYSPTQKLAASSVVDNRNGLVNSTSVTLSYQFTNTVSTTRSVSSVVKAGMTFDFKAKGDIFGFGVEASTHFAVDYTYTSSDATTSTQARAQTVTQQVAVDVPANKVYKAVLIAHAQQVDVPYRVNITVSGITETWFEEPVRDHYNWKMDIGPAFGHAGDPQYALAANGKGVVMGVGGVLTAQQTTDFVVQIWDITAEYSPTPAFKSLKTPAQRLIASPQQTLLPEGAILVSSTPIDIT
ncbi:aerolysin family beta-barrel pore-forming toxin [Glaciimonas sp. GG7]